MKKDLTIKFVQPDVIWKDARANLHRYDEMLGAEKGAADLLVFPEMFQTGFCSDPEDVAEKMDGDTVRWMKRTAEAKGCAVAGSLIIKENRRYFNRMVYIDPYQNLTWYDKRHLFNIDSEELKYTRGLKRLVIPLKDWWINFQICYDLRFPVWARNRNDYDVLIYLSNWPSNRNDVWETLLKARALENQSYVIGVNRVGTDKNQIHYLGNSMALDPKGKVLVQMHESHEGILSATLSWEYLETFRKEFPVWKDADDFEISY